MGRILGVAPESGAAGDTIDITIVYDENVPDPTVVHVLFHERQNAKFEIINKDPLNRHLTIKAEVPQHASTGGLEIDLEQVDTPITGANFTVTSNGHPLKIARLVPAVGPYHRGSYLSLYINIDVISRDDVPSVFFPVTTNGPPTKSVISPAPAYQIPNGVKVKIPEEARSGRVKVLYLHFETALSNRLTIV